ncbi:hypothetical protein [Pseudobutyrivibrio sp.]|uniref:hypothetical protein n=1 Tax=Pseudobutyrivibrio sp. TaxID=2014367 RepID=UPI001D2D0539|nr:hypothetical protein [Pseudobutyrivibrio sp.]MBE5912171.1 hypothetical protein [Pseudobutyrivibrio sp.]
MNIKATLKTISKVLGIVFITTILILVIYIMANGLGLIEGLDFGAGAYYYADIPEFAKYVNADHFRTSFPMWLHIGLFLLWGVAMYRLWTWLEKRSSRKGD